MPKTKDAFALRDFDINKFLAERLEWREFPELTDGDDPRELTFKGLRDFKLNLYERKNEVIALHKRIIRHEKKLGKYQSLLLKKIALATNEDEYSRLRKKSRRVIDLSDKYSEINKKLLEEKQDINENISYVENVLEELTLMKFSSRLRELRSEKNLTQTQLAQKLGLTQKIISCYETARSAPSFHSLLILATEYDLSIDWLLGLTD